MLGLDIAFRPGADMERAASAARLVEERFAGYTATPRGAQSRDVMLTFLALGLADELLQMKMNQERIQKKLEALIEKIEKSH